MLTVIPIGVVARNEAKNLPVLLESLRVAVDRAAAELGRAFEIHILLNDTSDNSAEVLAAEQGIEIWNTTGGLVEAQRAFAARFQNTTPFLIFSDADIRIEPEALLHITRIMLDSPDVEVAYAHKIPIPPMCATPLARALYLYNLREGYQTTRHYLNGQFFAIRHWNIPAPSELTWHPGAENPFLNLAAGIRCDDIYLSRDILSRKGAEALRCVSEARIRYRPPETLRGMFRKYQRMVLEIERLNHYFPRTGAAHARRLDPPKLKEAPLAEKFYYALFQLALVPCKLAYRAQKLYYTYVSRTPCPTWLPVEETKERVP